LQLVDDGTGRGVSAVVFQVELTFNESKRDSTVWRAV